MVPAEGNDLGVVPEALAQSQLGDGLHGEAQQVGTQRNVLIVREGLPLGHQLLHQLRDRRATGLIWRTDGGEQLHGTGTLSHTFRMRGKLFFSVSLMALW